jgi:hypothetical protein
MKLRKRHARPSIINESKKPSKNATFIDNVIFKEEDVDIKISPTQTQNSFISRQDIANNSDTNNSSIKKEPTQKNLMESEDILIKVPGM